ncbi:MAG TPA: radical SAM protein [Bdellovibrionota bacterium]|nr:radical SAM protein [Bdellovibrionota bacterium]
MAELDQTVCQPGSASETPEEDLSVKWGRDGRVQTVDEKKFSFWKDYVFPKAFFFTVGFPKDSFASVDITNRCNLRCKHCYFYEQDVPEEMTDEAWIQRFEAMSKGINRVRSVTWIGGEPLLRKDLIEIGKKYFPYNLIVTNGLIPLPDWRDALFHVSIDGDEVAHEKQRNQKGIYKQIMKNVDRPELDVSIAYCVSSLNQHCIEKVLEEWRGVGVKGFLFSFYTPIESIHDPLFPGWEARDRIIDRLIELKETKYGDYIHTESRVLELMKSANSKKVTDNCIFMTKGMALDPVGKRKAKCMMGDKADCDRCGCVVPFYLHWRSEKSHIVREVYDDLTHFFSSRARHLWDLSSNTQSK